MWGSLDRVSNRVKIVRTLHTCWWIRVPPDTPEKLAYTPSCVFRNSNDGRIKKGTRFSVTVWEPGTGGQDVKTRSSRSQFRHDEMDTVPNLQVHMTFNWSSYTTRRQRIAQTATMSVIDTPRELQLPQKAQPIREPLQFKSS